jgi:hypothetical protein
MQNYRKKLKTKLIQKYYRAGEARLRETARWR